MSLGNLVPSKFRIDTISRKDLTLANYTNKNVLLATNPEVPYYHMVKDKTLDYVASASENIYASDNSFYDSFAKKGAVMEVESDLVRHRMRGTGKVKCISKEPLMKDHPNPGVGHSLISVKLDKQIYQSSDTIYPEHEPGYRFTVQGKPHNDGTGFIYKLQLHTKNRNSFVPQHVLKSGVIWKKGNATFSEGSGEWGSTYTMGTSILIYQSSLTTFSKMHEVTDEGYMHAARIRGYKGEKQIEEKIIGMPEAEMMAQFRYERQHTLFWGRAAGKNVMDVSTGSHRIIGEGAIEFYEDGNMCGYHRHKFSVNFLREKFRRFFYGKVPANKANIKVKAGLGLMSLVDQALTREYNALPVDRQYADYIKNGKTYPGSSTTGKHLSAPTFLGFDLKPYGTVEFEHLPMLDDFEMNGGRVDRKTGMPETSYWGFIDDVGLGTGNNMTLLRRKGSENYFYTCGALSPLGYLNQRGQSTSGFMSAHGRRTYTVHMGVSEGVKVKDTKRTMFIHPAEKF